MVRSLEPDVRDAVQYLASKYLVALYNHPLKPQFIGSAFIVECNGWPYLVTARHVLQNVERLEDVCFHIGLSDWRFLTGRLVSIGDPLDLAVLRFHTPVIGWLPGIQKGAVDVTMTRHDCNDEGRLFVFAGFPASKSRTSQGICETRPYSIVRPAVSLEPYGLMGRDSATHVAIAFDRKRERVDFGDGGAEQFPKPQGMSGSPVWSVRKLPDGRLGVALEGVAIEYQRDAGVMIATRFAHARGLFSALAEGNTGNGA